MPNRKWLVSRTNRQYIEYLSRSVPISPAIAQVLINRGIKTPQEARDFLNGGSFSDPFALAGMKEAVKAVHEVKALGRRVFVHGDYDTDGVTATAIMIMGLRTLGVEASYYIPNRFTDGYGFNPRAVTLARQAGAGLIITVDCGITSFEACAFAQKEGIGVIITDHHEPLRSQEGTPVLPEAIAVINPKIDGTLSALSGAGVAMKFIEALGLPKEDLIDLAGLGTIADSVPLIGENRAIVKAALGIMAERPGLKALADSANLNGRAFRANSLSFTLIPRINAAGRLADASCVVELLLAQSEAQAVETAHYLERLNAERQKTEEAVLEQALGQISHKGLLPAIVVAGEGWHEGVVGIVASKLAELYMRPAFVLSISGQIAKGSARSVPAFDVHRGLSTLKDMLMGFGGHRQAAGLKIKSERLGEFEQRICRIVEQEVADFTPTLMMDADIGLDEVNFTLAREISELEPFGSGNPEPIFGSKAVEMLSPRVVGGNHLKMRLRAEATSIDAIGFDMGGMLGSLNSSFVDAAYNVTINDWEGGRTLQLNLKAIRPSENKT